MNAHTLVEPASEPVLLWDTFKERARSFPDVPAVGENGTSLLYSELFPLAERLADALAAAGVNPGATVALMLPNSLSFLPVFLSLCRLPARIVLASPQLGSSELREIALGLRIDSVVTTSELAAGIKEKLSSPDAPIEVADPRFPFRLARIPWRPERNATAVHLTQLQRDHLRAAAVIKTTSGSTGSPKSVALSARAILAEAENVARSLSLAPGDRIVAPVPLSHSYGFDLGVLAALASGATLQILGAIIPRQLLAALGRNDTAVFLGVPSMYQVLLASALGAGQDLTPPRYALSCTAPLHPRVIEAFHARFGVPLCQHYGSSETGALATHVPAEVLRRPTSVGVPIQNVTLRVVDADAVEVPRGSEGEVLARSDALALGYITGEPTSRSPFEGGWYRTGDRGVIDQEGFLHLKGRTDDVINVGGLKVSPSEVANVLLTHPAVQEAAVVGVPDPSAGNLVYAAVTLQSPATEEELIRHCLGQLADYKIPRRVEIRDEMPRGPSGKVKLRKEDLRL